MIWQCGQKYSNKEKCTSTHLYEDEIKEAFVHWVNDLIKNKPKVIQSCEQVLEEVMATEKLETEIQELEDKSSELFKKLREMLKSGGKDPDIEALMKSSFLDDKKHYETMVQKIQELQEELEEKKRRKVECKKFLEKIGTLDEPIFEFSEELWVGLVGKVTVDNSLTITPYVSNDEW